MTEKNLLIWEIKDRELLNLIAGRPGGKTTSRIIDKILEQPYNKNQLTNILNLDYNTISYHLEILCNHNYATEEKFEQRYYYHPSNKLFNSMEDYNLIKEILKKR
jgi:predicted transcriptional regulator